MVFLAGWDAAQSEPVDVTVGVLLDGWQEWVRRRAEANQLAPNTVAGYGYVTAHVRTAFGACLAAEVTVDSGQIIDLTSRLIAPNAAAA